MIRLSNQQSKPNNKNSLEPDGFTGEFHKHLRIRNIANTSQTLWTYANLSMQYTTLLKWEAKINTIDVGKAFDKIRNSFLIKTLLYYSK